MYVDCDWIDILNDIDWHTQSLSLTHSINDMKKEKEFDQMKAF